ncbi:MAG: hypothetical protein ACREO3_10715, partial [Arenimonas sp.]
AGDAARTRAATFAHEAGLRAIGVACLAFGGVMTAVGSVIFVETLGYFRYSPGSLVFSAFMTLSGLLGFAAAWGFLRLEPWVRWLALPLAAAAVLATFGLATPAVLHAAWLTWSKTGRALLSPGFAAVVAKSPGWPRWWQQGHVLAMVAMVAAYAAWFYGVMQGGSMED